MAESGVHLRTVDVLPFLIALIARESLSFERPPAA